MRYGIESRLPLLDHEFVELCFNLPNKFKMIYGQQRAILKYLFRHHVDKSVILNNKRIANLKVPLSKILKIFPNGPNIGIAL